MNDSALFESTVPVFQHYLERVDALLQGLPENSEDLLELTLAPHAFSAAEHLQTAIGFTMRTVLPLLNREVPESNDVPLSREILIQLVREAESLFAGITRNDFEGVEHQVIQHIAGTARLEQDATSFVTLFALPNFFFHLSMAFAIFRHQGVSIGKSDFDGLHVYAAGFHF